MAALTYLVLNSVFILIAYLFIGRVKARRSRTQLLIALAHVLILTAVFDSLIILAGIVAYDTSKISGLMGGLAPLEDFAYAIVAVIFVPLLWTLVGSKKGGDDVDKR